VTLTDELSVPDNTPTRCLTIPRRGRTGWGASSECLRAGVLQVFHYPEPESSTDATVYYAWPEVPADAVYVTFESPLLTAWQRPIEGVAVFPVEDGPVDAVARAVGPDGQSLGEVAIAASYNGAQYLPGMTPTSEPQPYAIPGGLTPTEECEVVPLSALGPGDEPTMLVHDHGTGVPIEFDKREYCRQAAALQPEFTHEELTSADLDSALLLRNGALVLDYHDVGTGEIVPYEEVLRRVAAARAGG